MGHRDSLSYLVLSDLEVSQISPLFLRKLFCVNINN